MAKNDLDANERQGLSAEEFAEVQERLKLRVPVVYKIVKHEGEEELSRPTFSLWWSGVAAGIAISMSVAAEGTMHHYLPDKPWRPLIENFGYTVGFLIVVLGRLQLFTENTITAVLPLIADRTMDKFISLLRLWAIVFLANIFGTFMFALATTYGGIFPAEHVESFRSISHHFMQKDASEMLLHGIPAGFLIAAMVWMIPSAENAIFWVVLLVTYVIALGDMSHVVAGSTEAFLLLLNGEIGLHTTFMTFMIPTYIGNVIGGTVLFAMLAYGQVKDEL